VVLVPFARSGQPAGLHAFVECDPGTDATALTEAHRTRGGKADIVQPVPALPRDGRGAIRHDVLTLVAQGRTEALAQLTQGDPALAEMVAGMVRGRRAG
jgi:hypothetical protein